MDLYEVFITPYALSQLEDYINYIQFTLFNSQAAESVWQDALATAEKLESSAGSLHLCDHPKLKELGYRLVFFNRHNYVMLYRIVDRTVYVDAVYHQLQDYENIFAREVI